MGQAHCTGPQTFSLLAWRSNRIKGFGLSRKISINGDCVHNLQTWRNSSYFRINSDCDLFRDNSTISRDEENGKHSQASLFQVNIADSWFQQDPPQDLEHSSSSTPPKKNRNTRASWTRCKLNRAIMCNLVGNNEQYPENNWNSVLFCAIWCALKCNSVWYKWTIHINMLFDSSDDSDHVMTSRIGSWLCHRLPVLLCTGRVMDHDSSSATLQESARPLPGSRLRSLYRDSNFFSWSSSKFGLKISRRPSQLCRHWDSS